MRGIRRIAGLALASLVAGTVLAPVSASAQDDDLRQTDTVTVGARREVDVEPDLGILTLGVRVHARTAERATERLSARTTRVVKALEDMGFTDDELETYGVELQRVCLDRCRDPNPRDNRVPQPVFGYRGTAGIRLETGEIDMLGRAIDAAVAAGANSVRGISYDVKDKSAAVNEALRQAMQLAVEKARILAETGGRRLGPAIVITEGRTQAPVRFEVPDANFASVQGTTSGGSGTGGGGGASFPIEPPTLSASARVTATFELD